MYLLKEKLSFGPITRNFGVFPTVFDFRLTKGINKIGETVIQFLEKILTRVNILSYSYGNSGHSEKLNL